MPGLFGTDGVRGIPGRYPLVPETVGEIARAAARLLRRRDPGAGRRVLMGRDTRGSGRVIGRWLRDGFAAAGCATVDVGVVPTPGVAYLTPRERALAGVVISASHNPARFNGIKFFTADGYKMPPDLEQAVERGLGARGRPRGPTGAGRVGDGEALVGRYVDFLRSTFPATVDLRGLRIVVDCGHGAAAGIAPGLLAGLGAEVIPIGCEPDGGNINSGCGALFTRRMRAQVRRRRAHCGVSFDGDADRAIFADETGAVLDGDAIICLAALRLQRQSLLRGDKVVLTVMSNFGLIRFLRSRGISVVSVPVGDRNVTDAIEAEGLSLGGEASGHIVFRSFASTGDGMLTALQTLAAWRESGGPLSAVRRLFRPVPQVLRNLIVARKVPLERLPRLRELTRRCERELAGEGRVFLRYSGTEPLLRIMIEGPSQVRIARMAGQLSRTFLLETGQKE
ncbi:MAG: phosphoglucosamine mutase [Elusimicrobia bacterium]|nr:phosphoglucosamine mutase [Elusimicrobiota bacterium]